MLYVIWSMKNIPTTQTIRQAQKSDQRDIHRFINSSNYIHRHLDWRDSLEWLGRAPFLILEENQEIQAVLVCPPEPEEVAWIRLFAVGMHTTPGRSWKKMLDQSLAMLTDIKPASRLTTLALREWYEEIIKKSGFHHHQDIVVFMYDTEPPPEPRLNADYRLHEMRIKDLLDVITIDHLAFEPIWRLSTDDLLYAAKKSSYCTVIERNDEIIAYQMSSSSGMYAHLARLAVHPDFQGQRLGFWLVQNLLDHFLNQENAWGVTLNTQSSNAASIKLYQQIGFRETGERFPVYIY